MKEIYLVTQGSHSDYEIRDEFVDKDLATEYAVQISATYDVARVETRPINVEKVTQLNL